MRLLAVLVLCGAAATLARGQTLEGAIALAIGLLLFGIGQAMTDVRRRKARRT